MKNIIGSFFSTTEARRLIALGLPVYIAQMANTGMNFIDTAMTGQASATDMAAVAVASSLWMPISVFGLGVLLVISPLVAQCVGAGDRASAPHLLRQGIWCALLLCVPLMLLLYAISWNFSAFGLDENLATLAGGYMRATLWGLPGLLLFVCARGFLEGFSCTRPAMMVAILGLLLNIPCNYVLIYGKLGLPALGAVGCGIATALCFWFMAFCTFIYARCNENARALAPIFSPLWRKGSRSRFDAACVRRIFRIGIPGALALLFEVSLFAVTALLLAPLGTVVVAGHQIALNVSAILFVVPMSFGITTTIRVGHCAGAGQWTLARLTAGTALTLAVGVVLVTAVLVGVLRNYIVLVYSSNPAVLHLAAYLLLYTATFQVVDAVQAIGVGILRGYNDTRIISVVCFVAYWLVSLPLGFVLARTDWLGASWGAAGFWLAYLVGLGFGGVCYMSRVAYLHRQSSAWLAAKLNK